MYLDLMQVKNNVMGGFFDVYIDLWKQFNFPRFA